MWDERESDPRVRRLKEAYVAGEVGLDTLERRIARLWEEAARPTLPPRAGLGARWVSERRRVASLLAHRRQLVVSIPPPPAGPRARWVLGRGRDADLGFDGDPSVSRRHALLVRTESGWLVRDLHSTNGTFVNGWRITEAEVAPGDVIELGGTAFSLR